MKKEILQTEQDNLNQVIEIIEENINKLKLEEKERRLRTDLPSDSFTRRKIQQNIDARKKLYFGRLDFIADGQKESYYIGKVPVEKNLDENIILDWRSPIADAYYSFLGGEGETTYHIPEINKDQKIQIHLKRDIQIKNDKVTRFKDTLSDNANELMKTETETPEYEDSFLSNLLAETSVDHGIKDIIATIQKEQNEIIRMDYGKTAIIQGVAGSGKSTIALHRISYLLYRYRNTLKPEDILIIAPNIVFLKYIQDILPDLEINNISQHTFASLAKELLPPIKGEVEVPYITLASIVDGFVDTKDTILISQFKGSIQLKKIIDKYLELLERDLANTIEPFGIMHPLKNEDIIFAKESIQASLDGFKYLPIEKRRQEVLKTIENWKNDTYHEILNDLENELKRTINIWVAPLKKDSSVQKNMIRALENAHHYKKSSLKRKINLKWRDYKKNWKSFNARNIYEKILQPELIISLDPTIDPHIIELLNKNTQTYEDLAPLMYIERRLQGVKRRYKHIVVDEAQDLSPFQFAVLKLFTSSMTIIGDVTQSVYPHTGIKQWESIVPEVFQDENIKRGDMVISYRSTVEIMELANKIITNGKLPYPKVVPVNRQGHEVKIKKIIDDEDLLSNILDSIKHFSSKSYKKIAIIHKDTERCERLFKALEYEGVDSVELILDANQEINKNIIIIPSYLVKGLEFDAVIIPNASESNYSSNDLDAKLLFISSTRAHHDLHIYFHQQLTPLLEGCKTIQSKNERRRKLSIL